MKLRSICEDIRKTDFFDFYALADTYLDLKQTGSGGPSPFSADPEYLHEVEQELFHVAKFIYNDQIDQLAEIIAQRWVTEDNIEIYRKHGVSIFMDGNFGVYNFEDGDVKNIPRANQISLIYELIKDNESPNEFTSSTWLGIAKFFLEVAKPKGKHELLQTIDRIYGATHHNGAIVDYFDEHEWLEKALNTRTIVSPRNLIARTSNKIRELLTSASIGLPEHQEIDILQELKVALNRAGDRFDSFGFGYKPIDESHFQFSLTYRIAAEPGLATNIPRPIGWGKWRGYNEWENHDPDQDEEHTFVCLGTIKDSAIFIQPLKGNPNLRHRIVKNQGAASMAQNIFMATLNMITRSYRAETR